MLYLDNIFYLKRNIFITIMEISTGLRTPRRMFDYEFDQERWLMQV